MRRVVLSWALVLALASSAAAVTLGWDPPESGDVVGYTMYRGILPGMACTAAAQPSMELYGVAPAEAQPRFVDREPVIGANYYEVTAYNSEGESLPSNRVCFQRQAVVTSAPRVLRVER